jgi:general stress protein 26
MRRQGSGRMLNSRATHYVASMKTKTITAEQGGLTKLQELVRDIDIAMVTTVTPDGALRSRPMVTRKFDDEGRLWFFTADDSGMAHDLHDEHAVNVSYAEPKDHRYVSVTGNAMIVRNREQARELWQPAMKSYFPLGLDDPHLALLCVRIETAEFWDSPASKVVQLYETTKAAATGGRSDLGDHAKVEIRAARESG